MTVQIVITGAGLEKNPDTIVDNGWDMICVSSDGPREVHDKCLGVKGALDAAIKGISEIKRLKALKNKKKPALFVLTTISKNNQDMLLETVKEAVRVQKMRLSMVPTRCNAKRRHRNVSRLPRFRNRKHQDSTIQEIYNGEKHWQFRRALRSCENGVFPICSRCCGLMGY